MDTKHKQRGLALATIGLAVAVGVLVLLDTIWFVEITARQWVVTFATCAATVGGAWLLLQRGARLWRGWDPHFVLVPSIAVAILLSEFVWVAPETRLLVLVVWPVVLIFLAGYAGFRTALLLTALMTAGYLGAVALSRPAGVRLEVEVILAVVFFITNLFAAIVLGRIRHQRLALAEARAELSRLVYTDALTGLPNRRHFSERFDTEVARVARYGGSFTLALLDCDHFKDYNDRHGHPAGDDALRELGMLLREQLRASDSVARLGGEEFAVLMVGADPALAGMVAERLRARIAGHAFGATTDSLTVSIGIASAPEDADTPEALFRLADQALYAAKAQGRNCVALALEVPATLAR
ncbi:MAG TPA: GGDEF domain-containing protein [Longimicrobium sp.]|nr:GGDEF domain-containing protein [Longimicrobium sp.]